MKSMFKKVLHVLLALAIIYACPFSVHAADGCEHRISIWEVEDTIIHGTEDCCTSTGVYYLYWCDKCGYEEAELLYEYDFTSHSFVIEGSEQLPDGSYKITSTCTTCGLTESQVYYPYSLRK